MKVSPRPAVAPHYEYNFKPVEWCIPGVAPAKVFEIVRDVSRFPKWWREVRDIDQRGGDRWHADIRSFLPYSLNFEMERTRERFDPSTQRGTLEVSMKGDLEGWSRWTIGPDGMGGTTLVFEESANTHKRLLDVLERIPGFKSLFSWNHAQMMKHGEEGLRRYLDGLDS